MLENRETRVYREKYKVVPLTDERPVEGIRVVSG